MKERKHLMQEFIQTTGDVRGVYRHWKGGEYVVFAVTVLESQGTALVHYYSFEKRYRWSHHWHDFFTNKQEGAVMVPRFEPVRPATREELIEAAGI